MPSPTVPQQIKGPGVMSMPLNNQHGSNMNMNHQIMMDHHMMTGSNMNHPQMPYRHTGEPINSRPVLAQNNQGHHHYSGSNRYVPPQTRQPPTVEVITSIAQSAVSTNSTMPAANSVNTVTSQMQPTVQAKQEDPESTECENAASDLILKQTMANMKEKTPMCLINELTRYNAIKHQYRLTDESGPAHKKTFTVVLKLGEEEYTSSGPSIKKAQHAAASTALDKTAYKHPPPKPHRPMHGLGTITPTVELNALAKRRGETTEYTFLESPRQHYHLPNFNFRGMYHQRYHYPRYAPLFYVSLRVGNHEYFGEGRSTQAARHNAAFKALRELRELPLPEKVEEPQQESNVQGEPDEDDDEDTDVKSPISLVHEMALKRNLPVVFEVTKESGPPHMRTFITKCIVGDMTTDGEGNGKKVSKKKAAEKMMEELKKLPALPPSLVQKVRKKPAVAKKKSRNLIKVSEEQKGTPDYGQGINPISRLIQIQQAKKEKEPVYTLVAERGLPRRREFIMQVAVGPHTCTGNGPNKKLAKRAAAEGLLQLLGYSRPQPLPSKPAIKSGGPEGIDNEKGRKVTFLDHEGNPRVMNGDNNSEGVDQARMAGSGRQIAPGLLLMPDGTSLNSAGDSNSSITGMHGYISNHLHRQHTVNNTIVHTTAAIARELLEHGSSPTAEAFLKSSHKSIPPCKPLRPKQQLIYLADVLGIAIQFTDFPKGNKSEYLSLVSLASSPPHVSHGGGLTLDASHDQSALTALRTLAEMTIDDGKPGSHCLGDGIHIGSGNK